MEASLPQICKDEGILIGGEVREVGGCRNCSVWNAVSEMVRKGELQTATRWWSLSGIQGPCVVVILNEGCTCLFITTQGPGPEWVCLGPL